MIESIETQAMPKLAGDCSKCGATTAYPIKSGAKTWLYGDCWTEKQNLEVRKEK